MLERVRERLNATNERIARERDAAREQANTSQTELEARSSREEELASRYALLQDRLRAAEDKLARAESTVREVSAQRELAAERAQRFHENGLELERQMTGALHALSRSAALVRSLEEAHERAAESIALLEDMRSRLEFELASRVTLAESKVVKSTFAIQQLISERAMLADTLTLRERRIANLEDALRRVTVDFVRTTELELQRYRAALASVEASPIGRLRVFFRGLLRRPAVISQAARRTTVLAKRRRHLRSA
jgi:chromosome segregation ATPase